MGYASKDIQLRSPSGEMQRIASLISEKEARREEILGIIQEKKTVVCEARAEVLLSDSRGAKIKAGLSQNALESFGNELREAEETISGLRAKLVEAEAAEKERLYGELSDTVRREGGTLLDLIDRLEANMHTHNDLVSQVTDIMKQTFWKTNAEALLGVGGCKLPNGVLKFEPDFSTSGNFFLDRLRSFCGEAKELLKSPHDALPAQAV